MLSPRVWFERFPRQLRLLVACLAMLSFVAPTWHVCSLGGHVMAMSHQGEAMNHNQSFPLSSSGALICFCAPRHKDSPVRTSFPARPWMKHRALTHGASCLALLLSGMPALLALPFWELPVLSVSFPVWFANRHDEPTRERTRTFSNRGPPVDLGFRPLCKTQVNK